MTLRRERFPVQFLFRAHGWAANQYFSPSLSPSPPLSLKVNEIFKEKEKDQEFQDIYFCLVQFASLFSTLKINKFPDIEKVRKEKDKLIFLIYIFTKRYLRFHVYCSVICTAKTRKQHQRPTDKWIKKSWCMYTMEYYSDIRKDKILPYMTT